MTLIGPDGLISKNMMIFIIGFVTFVFCYKYSVTIFDWIERQTLGTRTYLLEKFDLLFFVIEPEKLTIYLIAFSSFVFTSIVIFFGIWFSWIFGFIAGTIAGFFSFRIPKIIVDILVEKRVKLYSGQMVDGLQLLSNGIRAGLSVPQSLGMVVDEMPNPISQEFNLILKQNRIGVTLEECFENLVKRVPTEDNEMFVASMNILRETGGNLAEVFDTIVGVIRERVRLQQKIDTYVAQGMFQGMTIAAMPFAITAIYAVSDPDSVKGMFTNPVGIILVIAAVILDIIGFVIILKIVKIKI